MRPDPAARGRAGIASTARQAGEGHKRIDSTVSVRALPGGILLTDAGVKLWNFLN